MSQGPGHGHAVKRANGPASAIPKDLRGTIETIPFDRSGRSRQRENFRDALDPRGSRVDEGAR